MDFDLIIEDFILDNHRYMEDMNEEDISAVVTAFKTLLDNVDISSDREIYVRGYDVRGALNKLYHDVSIERIEPRLNALKEYCNEACKEFKLKMKLPSLIRLINDKARHKPDSFRKAMKSRKLWSVFLNSLNGMSALDSEERIGQLCAGLVLSSWVIDGEDSVMSIIQKTDLIQGIEGIDEQLVWQYEQSAKKTKRSYPLGSITSQLYRLMRKDDGLKEIIVDADAKKINYSVKKFFLGQQLPRSECPKSLRELQKWVCYELGEILPPLISEYLKGGLSSVAKENENENETENEELDDIVILSEICEEQNKSDRLVIKEINSSLKKNDSSVLTKFNSSKVVISPMVQYLIKYGCLLIKGDVATQKTNKTSTFANYFRQLGKPFYMLAPVIEIKNITDWYRLYDDILLSKVTLKERQATRKNLKNFHIWLKTVNSDVPHVEFKDLEGYVNEEQTINARVVTVKEYEKVKNILHDRARNGGEYEWYRFILFILAFRTGARRSDLCNLKRCHLRGEKKYLEIIITESKSKSGRRWLPLVDLLSQHELMLLLWWLRKYPKDPNEYLFSINREVPNISRLTRPVIVLLKQITGDSKVVYHTLRHSFSTARFIMIFIHHLPNIERLDIPWVNEIIEDQKSMNNIVLLPLEKKSRRHLYQQALLMGHLDPAITLSHYVHCMHVIILGYLLAYEPDIKIEQCAPLIGYKKSSAYTILKSDIDNNRNIKLANVLKHMRPSMK